VTVIYLDSLFLLNAIVDYLLLLATARLTGAPFSRLRLLAGAAVGAGYAAALFLPGLGWLDHPLCRLCAALVMVLAAFGGQRRLLRALLSFFGLAAAFGGGIYAISLPGGRGLTLSNGVFCSVMDLRVILLSAAGCYVLLTLVFRRVGRHTAASGEIRTAVLTLEGRRCAFPVLLDTGNTLTDPATGRPVLVAEGALAAPLFPSGAAPSPQALSAPACALETLSAGPLRGRLRLLPYQAVGVERGLLLALRLDSLRVGVRDYGKALVALSPNPLTDGGGYGGLIGPEP
jgi:stage II sporulation protein GA (sporulation sigma-E factor processing peptidase)